MKPNEKINTEELLKKIENYFVETNDSKFDDVSQIIGDDFQPFKVYIITNSPASDGNYIQSGATHTVIGIETADRLYGYQLSLSYGGIKFREKFYGKWTTWREIRKTENIVTGEEFETGRIIDGKVEYGKRIECGDLPDGSGVKTIEHGITNFMITKIEAYAYSSAYGRWMTLPLVENGASSAYNVSFNVDTSKITLNSDNSQNHYVGYVTIYYTKN